MILDGGAVRGAFMGGVLAELHARGYKADYWDMFVGTSIGGTSATYFSAGQIEEGLRFFTEHMPKGFISKFCGIPRFDLAYLAWAYRESPDALDVQKLRKSTPVYMPIANEVTGEPDFVCVNSTPDPTWPMLQGVRVPILTHNIACIEGKQGWDGGFVCCPPVCHPKVKEATEVWYLSPVPEGGRESAFKSYFYALLLGGFDPQLWRMIARMSARSNTARDEIEKIPNLRIIRPKKPLKIGWAHQNVGEIDQVISEGRLAAHEFLYTYERRT